MCCVKRLFWSAWKLKTQNHHGGELEIVNEFVNRQAVDDIHIISIQINAVELWSIVESHPIGILISLFGTQTFTAILCKYSKCYLLADFFIL